MGSKYYYVENGEEVGPVTSRELRQKVLDGVIGPDDEVWKQGLANWVPARKIKGLIDRPGKPRKSGKKGTQSRQISPPETADQPLDDWDEDWAEDWDDESPPSLTGLPAAPIAALPKAETEPPPPPPVASLEPSAPLADRLLSEPDDFAYAGFFRRLIAWMIDTGLILLFVFASMIVAGLIDSALFGPAPGGQPLRSDMHPAILLGWVLVVGIGGHGYFIVMECSPLQATIGKMLLRMIVTDEHGDRIGLGRSIARTLLRHVSGSFFNFGYLMQPFTARRQTLHDIVAGTLVCLR